MDLKTLLQRNISAKKRMYRLYEKNSIFMFISSIKFKYIFNILADKNPEEIEKDEDEYFQKMYQQWKGMKDKDNDPTYKIIPKFYFKVLLMFCILL